MSSKNSHRLQTVDEYFKKLVPSNDLTDPASPRLYGNKLSDLSYANEIGAAGCTPLMMTVMTKMAGSFSLAYLMSQRSVMILIGYPIGRAKNSKLVQNVQVDAVWTTGLLGFADLQTGLLGFADLQTRLLGFADDEDEVTVAAVALLYGSVQMGLYFGTIFLQGHTTIQVWHSTAVTSCH